MRTYFLSVSAACVMASALVSPGSAQEQGKPVDAEMDIAARIVEYAGKNGINRIGVLEFLPEGGVSRNEAALVSEQVSVNVGGVQKTALTDLMRLQAAMEYARSSGDGPDPAKVLKDAMSVEAVVTGRVFRYGTKYRVFSKLTDSRTGQELFTAEAEGGRGRNPAAQTPGAEFPGFAGPYTWQEPAASPAVDLRDSVSDSGPALCAERKAGIAELNAKLVEHKARYWAAKMREPYFGVSALGKNPGIEIGDPATREKFYELLAAYYAAAAGPDTEPGRSEEVKKLLDDEIRFLTECGFR